MYIELNKRNSNSGWMVNRICDDCGQEKEIAKCTVLIYRKKRGNDKDYCHKCSYKYRVLIHKKLENSPYWKGGRGLNGKGYFKIYLGGGKYVYEHKMIMEKHLGRTLSKKEKVHHIDLVKSNNSIENMYLCEDKTSHWRCHQSMEECAFNILGKEIWFDVNEFVYKTTRCDKRNLSIYIEDILSMKTYSESRRKYGKQYFLRTIDKKAIHVLVAERIMGRKMFANETVHHINGDTLDNSVDNIIVMTRSQHKKCHYSLQYCVANLYISKKINFINGIYKYNV